MISWALWWKSQVSSVDMKKVTSCLMLTVGQFSAHLEAGSDHQHRAQSPPPMQTPCLWSASWASVKCRQPVKALNELPQKSWLKNSRWPPSQIVKLAFAIFQRPWAVEIQIKRLFQLNWGKGIDLWAIFILLRYIYDKKSGKFINFKYFLTSILNLRKIYGYCVKTKVRNRFLALDLV